MASDLIRYDLLVQDALRAVMRKVLSDVAREGLPGEHHFFITFRTRAPGVRLSNRMREQYPAEMTVILQHQFWDLTVGDQAFEVGLSFHGKSETLLIPFDAVTGFFDPSVEFGLKFELAGEAAEPAPEALPQAAEHAPG
ncbi:MAG: ClpXP protease specificity-enhancing factor SspB, partial [Methylovirgula sp.]